MDIVRVSNIWNVHYVASKMSTYDIMDSLIVHQKTDDPLLPEGFQPDTKEYLDIIISECEGQRIALWIIATPSVREKIREFVLSVYEDARCEAI